MSRVKHLMRAARRYGELKAERQARQEAEKNARANGQMHPAKPAESPRADVDDKRAEPST